MKVSGVLPMSRERRLSEEDEAYLGPVAVAQFIDAGWIIEWPKAITRSGLRAIGNGYGRWQGTHQALPYPATDSPRGAAHWPGRRTSLPHP